MSAITQKIQLRWSERLHPNAVVSMAFIVLQLAGQARDLIDANHEYQILTRSIEQFSILCILIPPSLSWGALGGFVLNRTRFVLMALILVFCAGSVFAQTLPDYTFKLLDPNGTGLLIPYAMNNLGQITGQRYDGPFIYKDDKVMHLMVGSGTGLAINDAGDVVGMESGEIPRAFLYSGDPTCST